MCVLHKLTGGHTSASSYRRFFLHFLTKPFVYSFKSTVSSHGPLDCHVKFSVVPIALSTRVWEHLLEARRSYHNIWILKSQMFAHDSPQVSLPWVGLFYTKGYCSVIWSVRKRYAVSRIDDKSRIPQDRTDMHNTLALLHFVVMWIWPNKTSFALEAQSTYFLSGVAHSNNYECTLPTNQLLMLSQANWLFYNSVQEFYFIIIEILCCRRDDC